MANCPWLILYYFILANFSFIGGTDYFVFPSNVTIEEGEGFVLQVLPRDAPLLSCTVRGIGANIPLFPNGASVNGIKYWGESLELGACGIRVENSNITLHNGRWTFQMVTKENVTATASSTVTVKARGEPPPPIQVVAEIGGNTMLTCVAGVEDLYCKLKDSMGVIISSGTNCSITINNVKIADGGAWTCVKGTRNSVQEQETAINVTVTSTKALTIDLEDIEKHVAIHCHSSILKLSYCKFQRPDGVSLIMSDGFSFNRYTYTGQGLANNECGVLIEKPLSPEDLGVWKCVLGMQEGSESGGFITVENSSKNKDSRGYEHKTTQPNNTYAIVGGFLTMDCTVDAALDYCWFQHPNGTRFHGLQDSYDSAVWRYHGDGLSLGHCGLTINQTTKSDSGVWKCGMGLRGEPLATQDLQMEFAVVIAEELLIENTHEISAAHGEEITLGCHSLNGEAIHYCRLNSPNGTGFNLYPLQIQTPNSRYVYHGKGLDYGECGILIKKVTGDDFGTWQCGVRLVGNGTQELIRDLILTPPGISSSSAIGIAVALIISAASIAIYVIYRRRRSAQQRRPVAVSIRSDGSDDILDVRVN